MPWDNADVRLWLLADILWGTPERPLLPRKPTFEGQYPLSHRLRPLHPRSRPSWWCLQRSAFNPKRKSLSIRLAAAVEIETNLVVGDFIVFARRPRHLDGAFLVGYTRKFRTQRTAQSSCKQRWLRAPATNHFVRPGSRDDPGFSFGFFP